MIMKMLAVVMAAATVITGSPRPVEPPHQIILGPLTIMGVGDSITMGFLSPDGTGYRVRLDTLLAGKPHSFVGSQVDPTGRHHEGHSGWEADQLAAQITQWVGSVKPSRVLLMAGSNDIDHGNTPTQAFNDLKNLYTRAQAASPGTLFIIAKIPTITGKDTQVREFNALVTTLAARYVTVVDMYVAVPASKLVDGIHPTKAGYDAMADAWRPALPA